MNRANAWTTYEEADLKALEELCKEYKDFLSNGKTERECVAQSIELAEKAGYQDLEELIKNQTPLKAGDKVYRTWMEKTIVLFQIGEDAIEDGLNILGAHIDSPRLDLKQNPLYEDTEMALLDTHYYGGVKKYQWVTLPMALHGVVVKKDGTRVNICIGEKDEDPVVGITDLLIHLSGKQMQKKGNVIVEGEDLNVLIGSKPLKDEEKEAVKKQLLQLLDEEYGIEEEDFLSAEIEVVPAGKARDFGLDRSMIMSYGQDDRVCAYTSLAAMLNVEAPKQVPDTTMILNSIASGDNICASADYRKNRSKILDTGISLYEYMGKHSTHGKSLVIDDDIAVVGSYNFDCRSTYVDTETMLVVQGKEITKQLEEDFDGLKNESLKVNKDGSYQSGKNVTESTMDGKKKCMIRILSYIIQAFRYLA